MRKQLVAMAAAVVLAVPTVLIPAHEARAQGTEGMSWIHVRVDEADGARVRVNVPVSLAEVALEMAGKEGFEGKHAHWDHHGDVTLEDIRRLWRELRDAGDADFVEMQEGDEHVRVYRRGDRVFVEVDEDGTEKVRVRMPAAIVNTLLGTEGEELDLLAAMRELARSGDQDLVEIQDEGTRVRVWIDNVNTQSG